MDRKESDKILYLCEERPICLGNYVKVIDIYVKKVYFNQPYTIVIWNDGTKTIVKCTEGCKYDKYTGLATCFLKKFMGNRGFSKFKKIANNLIKDEE